MRCRSLPGTYQLGRKQACPQQTRDDDFAYGLDRVLGGPASRFGA
ncbi:MULTISPECIES: hypothetical protein [Streptomyces]|nr:MULTISPECIES: hypothetical protein [Streptomyces]MDX3066309.1 hypothetical protein [Streptomyces sp. ND04-05B]WRY86127.1 hypothetical protein OG388_35305 [Streptomyces clavifer]WUC31838.1 hypothetical protein OG927_32855 [Streptomyces clavifer]